MGVVLQTPMVLRFVPDTFRLDKEFILEMVPQKAAVLEYSGEFLRDEDFLLEAIRRSEFALHFVPEDFRHKRAFLFAQPSRTIWSCNMSAKNSRMTEVFCEPHGRTTMPPLSMR